MDAGRIGNDIICSVSIMERLSVSGLEECLHALGTRKGGDKNIYLLFCGDVSQGTGESWCPDCVKGSSLVLLELSTIFSL